jgi:hypothetical protein
LAFLGGGGLALSALVAAGLYLSRGSGAVKPATTERPLSSADASTLKTDAQREEKPATANAGAPATLGPDSATQASSGTQTPSQSNLPSRDAAPPTDAVGGSRHRAPGKLAMMPQESKKDRQSNQVGAPEIRGVIRGGNRSQKSPTFGRFQPAVPGRPQPPNVDQPATAAQITEIHRAIRETIAALEAGEFVKYYQDYAPIDDFRGLRNSGRLNSAYLPPARTEPLIATLKGFRDGDILVDADGSLARVTPHHDSETAGPESPNPSALVPSPKDDKVTLVGYGDDLSQVLKAGLAALEAGEIESFIDHLFPAGELGRLQVKNGKARLVARLKRQTELIEQMRRDLRTAGAAAAEFNPEKTLASITLPAASDNPEGASRIVKFQKVAGAWRFFDNSTPVREEMARQSRLVPPNLSYPVAPAGTVIQALVMEKIGSSWRLSEIPGPIPLNR